MKNSFIRSMAVSAVLIFVIGGQAVSAPQPPAQESTPVSGLEPVALQADLLGSLCSLPSFPNGELLAAENTSSSWSERSNTDLCDGNRPGWTINVPSKWVEIPDVTPSWPHGAGYRTPTGRTGIIIAWFDKVPESELETLKSREYIAEPITIAGIHTSIYTKRFGPSYKQVMYVERHGGVYRLSTFGETSEKAVLNKVLQSFAFSYSQVGHHTNVDYNDERTGCLLSYPATCTLNRTEDGFDIAQNGQVFAQMRFRNSDGTSGQSFRGLARSLGKKYVSGATSLAKFEPYVISGITGYQAVWETSANKYFGPVIYLPIANSSWQVLEFSLTDPGKINEFFKTASSIKLSPPKS